MAKFSYNSAILSPVILCRSSPRIVKNLDLLRSRSCSFFFSSSSSTVLVAPIPGPMVYPQPFGLVSFVYVYPQLFGLRI
ncbi:unnamed protein product, partial [Arabidopsis halleri]